MTEAVQEQSAPTSQNDQPSNTSSSRSSISLAINHPRSISFAGSDPHQPSPSTYEHLHTGQVESTTKQYPTDSVQDHGSRPTETVSAAHSRRASHTSDPASQIPKERWYSRLTANYQSISLENKGSVARDHLALERTFLAWLRTSLAFASIGIAITQLFRLNTTLADQKEQMKWMLEHWNISENFNSQAGPESTESPPSSLPVSPFVRASVTPDIYAHIQSILQQHIYSIAPANPSSSSSPDLDTLMEHLLSKSTKSDSDAAAHLRRMGKPLGATFLGISIVILSIGFHRYFESQHWIIRGQFPASRGSVALTGLVAGALIVSSLVVILVVAPTAYTAK